LKVGDLVKYKRRHRELQDLIGIVVESSEDRFRYDQIRVLWSDAHSAVWDWIRELRIVNETR
jgi:hypothetical protein